MPSATDLLPAIIHVDGIPDHEMVSDLLVRFIIGSLERAQCTVRKDDSPAIGDICCITLDDGNIMQGVGLFNEQAAIKSCRSSAKNNNFHPALLPSPHSILASWSS